MAKNDNGNSAGTYALPFEQAIVRLERQITDLQAEQVQAGRDFTKDIRRLRAQYLSLLRKTYQNLTAWETVQVARHPHRPIAADYIARVVKNFAELHGDRRFADDKAIIAGLGRIGTEKVAIIAQQKGRDTKEKIACNFGCPHPEGYRKALRVMRLAEKFSLPVVTLVDTAGAYPGIGSEERGVAEAIAVNLREMSRLRTPIIVIVIGEGGSGGALGLGVGDRMAMMEFAWYSVISPEGCAAILWRTGEKAAEAAAAMKLTARELRALDVIDAIIPEPLGGAHRDPAEAANNLERHIVRTLRELARISIDNLLKHRYDRWRRMGKVLRAAAGPPAAGGEAG
ncbi:MAG: acetyl-CoA carboxylase carboxyltransferase subunit alpha [Planctomycetes bacterium]|nr:acetyl-CoA carboxylase carboxyltransferase subunit alpha [Planctomycetota bacterium]